MSLLQRMTASLGSWVGAADGSGVGEDDGKSVGPVVNSGTAMTSGRALDVFNICAGSMAETLRQSVSHSRTHLDRLSHQLNPVLSKQPWSSLLLPVTLGAECTLDTKGDFIGKGVGVKASTTAGDSVGS